MDERECQSRTVVGVGSTVSGLGLGYWIFMGFRV